MIEAKKSVTTLKPYINGNHTRELIQNHKRCLKLDSNEATVSPSPRVITAITQYLTEGPLNWYPDVEATELREKLSDYTKLDKDYILCFNGSDHALETICRAYLNPGDAVLFFPPTYDHFRVYVESCDAHFQSAMMDEQQNLAQAIKGNLTTPRMVYLVNPNNPTGTYIDHTHIEEALEQFPRTLFVIDEAYFEFCGQTMAKHVTRYSNLIVTRSFSKAFGLASLRIGYTLASAKRNKELDKIRVGKNINALAQVAACASLDDIDHMNRYVDEVHLAKEWLLEKFESAGITARDTAANFLLIQIPNPQDTIKKLEEHNIYIRDRSKIPQLEGFIRITVGDMLTMNRFWKVFETLPQEWLINYKPQPQTNSLKNNI
jgi:histidinol-phosphate aminotransferase